MSNAKSLLPFIAAVSIFSCIGVAFRILLLRVDFISAYHNFLPNCIGSFVLGASSRYTGLSKLPYTQKGLQTGFCGSLTTFSSWIYDIITAPTLSVAVQELVTGLTLPLVFYLLGRESADLSNMILAEYIPLGKVVSEKGSRDLEMTGKVTNEHHGENPRNTQLGYYQQVLKCIEKDSMITDIGLLLTCIILSSVLLSSLRHMEIFSITELTACLIAPCGSTLRLILSTYFNQTGPAMRWGTLYANVAAVVLSGICLAVHTHHRSQVTALSVGVCGALSTASSWVADAVAIRESPPAIPITVFSQTRSISHSHSEQDTEQDTEQDAEQQHRKRDSHDEEDQTTMNPMRAGSEKAPLVTVQSKDMRTIIDDVEASSDEVNGALLQAHRRADLMRRGVAGGYYVGSVVVCLILSVPFDLLK